MWTWTKSLGQDFQRGLIANIIVAAGLGGVVLAQLKIIGSYAYDLANRKINISLALLLCALFYLLGRMNMKSKLKPDKDTINLEEFKLLPQGFYLNLKYDFKICPKCLHQEIPKVSPMTDASGPWKCVCCDYKISPKAACASSPPEPRREGFVNSWRR